VTKAARAKSRKAWSADCPARRAAVSVLLAALVAVLLSHLAASGAKAADLPLPAPSRYDADAPYTHWGGVYLGLNGGFGLGSSQWTQGFMATNIFNTDGFLLGGTVGFNYPVSTVLFGVEADLDWSTLNGSAGNCAVNGAGAVAACETKNNVLGTARGRMGYTFDRMLVFVTGGAAFGDVQTGLNPPATFDSTTRVGWAAGAGLEYAFSGSLSAKAEYLYVDLGTAPCTSASNCGSAAGASVTLTESLVRGGFNYRFSW
jgi:outer membrane immunogenic protein